MGILRRYGLFFAFFAMSWGVSGGAVFANVPAKNLSAFTKPNTRHVDYFLRGADGYLHYYYARSNKRLVDTSSFLLAGKVGGPVFGFYSPKRRHGEAIFSGEDGYIRYVYMTQSGWKIERLSRLGKVAGALSGFYDLSSQRPGMFFRGEGGYLHYGYFARGRWILEKNLFRRLGKVAGAIATVFVAKKGFADVFFHGEDGYVKRYFFQGRWQAEHTPFRQGGKITGDISATFAKQRNHTEFFYRGEDGFLRYFFKIGGRWILDSATFRKPGHRVGGTVSAVFASQRNHSEVMYEGEDGYIRYFYIRGNWELDTETFRKAKIAGSMMALFLPSSPHTGVLYEGDDAAIHAYSIQRGNWKHEVFTQAATTTDGFMQLLARFRSGRASADRFGRRSLSPKRCIDKKGVRLGGGAFTYRVRLCGSSDGREVINLRAERVWNEQLKVDAPSAGALAVQSLALRAELDRLFHARARRSRRSGHVPTVVVLDFKAQIEAELKKRFEGLKAKIIDRGLSFVKSQIQGGGKAVIKAAVLGLFNKAVNGMRDALIKHVMSRPASLESFYKNFHSLVRTNRANKIAAQATRINTVAALVVGIALEAGTVPVDTFLSCTGYSGRAKMCCLEKRLSYNLVGLVFAISSIVLQTILDAALIQPLSSATATAIAASLASVTAGVGGIVQPLAHILISGAMNGVMGVALMGWRALIFDPLTKPLVKEVTKLTAKILGKLNTDALVCQGPCASDNSPREQCKDTHSAWDFKKFQKESNKQVGQLRSRQVCLRAFRDNLYVSSKGGRILHADQAKCEGYETVTIEWYDRVAKKGDQKRDLFDGALVYLKSKQGYYWSAFSNGSFSAGATSRGENERFYLVAIGGAPNGKIRDNEDVALMSSHERYVSVGGRNKKLVADRTGRSSWEAFHMTPVANSTINACFMNWNGKYNVSTPPSGLLVKTIKHSQEGASRQLGQCLGWERHFIEKVNPVGPLRSGEKIRIRTNHGRYWSAQDSGALMANRKEAGNWEIFTIYKVGAPNGAVIRNQDRIALLSFHNRYLVAESGGGHPIFANRPKRGGWETFIIFLP